ncbi:hypothetical protein G6F43_003998 [Rhizopus delemar]|nr:hypothetical protein G6F43_003998 [Rhizopus delemar]
MLSYYKFGTLPLIITAPHGGRQKPSSIPDRTQNGSLVLQDIQMPYIVINLISRRKADTNRPIEEGTETEGGKRIWLEYHNFIEKSIEDLHKTYNFGLLLDIHGQTHEHGMVELGYLLEPTDIKTKSVESLDEAVLHKSSIKSLTNRHYNNKEPHQLLKQFGDKIAAYNHSVSAVPSTEYFEPDDVLYFSGGYTTQRYHFHYEEIKKGMDAIQIEIPKKFRHQPEGREQIINAVANATIYLLDNYYIMKPKL